MGRIFVPLVSSTASTGPQPLLKIRPVCFHIASKWWIVFIHSDIIFQCKWWRCLMEPWESYTEYSHVVTRLDFVSRKCGLEVKSTGSEARQPGFQSWFCHYWFQDLRLQNKDDHDTTESCYKSSVTHVKWQNRSRVVNWGLITYWELTGRQTLC